MTLNVRALSAGYGKLQVLRDIDLTADSQGLLVLLGPNGAGKSTLMSAIAGLVAGRGQIVVDGEDLQGLKAHSRVRRGVALVPEGRRNLFSAMTVDENLALALAVAPAAQRAERLERILAVFPVLGERRHQRAGLMSGGEQQMLAIAAALAHCPKVLMLDEPTQGLAPVAVETLAQSIRGLREFGLTILVAEQNIAFARRVAHTYAFIRNGRIGRTGAAGDLDDLNMVAEQLV
jgi:branched-chain amino acid transport system ATP-binding protein